jgi:hypothetical protein
MWFLILIFTEPKHIRDLMLSLATQLKPPTVHPRQLLQPLQQQTPQSSSHLTHSSNLHASDTTSSTAPRGILTASTRGQETMSGSQPCKPHLFILPLQAECYRAARRRLDVFLLFRSVYPDPAHLDGSSLRES